MVGRVDAVGDGALAHLRSGLLTGAAMLVR
jgi:hypothetical protein